MPFSETDGRVKLIDATLHARGWRVDLIRREVTVHPHMRGEHVYAEGTMYDVVFKKSPKGKMIVTKGPDMTNVAWSEAQQAQRGRFKQANDYAKAAMANPKIRAVYEKRAKKSRRYLIRVAFSDYFPGNDLLAKK